MVALAAAGAGSRPAEAHAFLVRTAPAAGERLGGSPSLIQLQFSEPVASLRGLDLRSRDGARVAIGRPETGRGGMVAEAQVAPLGNGVYLVSWQVVATDGHVSVGELAFAVGAVSGPVPRAAAGAGQLPPWPATIAHLLFIGGLLLALGGLAAELVVLPADARDRLGRLPLSLPLSVSGAGAAGQLAWQLVSFASLQRLITGKPGVVALVELGALIYPVRPWLICLVLAGDGRGGSDPERGDRQPRPPDPAPVSIPGRLNRAAVRYATNDIAVVSTEPGGLHVTITRRAALTIAAAASGLVALGIAAPVLLWREVLGPLVGRLEGQGGGNGGGMMGAATTADMSSYMDLFDQHTRIRRTVEQVPGGVRTTTESDDPALAARLQAHVSAMYTHLQHGQEVQCMSDSLPLLFRSASGYQRRLTLTAKGVSVIETSGTRSSRTRSAPMPRRSAASSRKACPR